MMRDCFFLVADKNTRYMVEGFLCRPLAHESLGCGPFGFDPAFDLLVAVGQNDPGIFARASDLIRGRASTHRHVAIVMDAAWDGSPGADAIRRELERHIVQAGWAQDDGAAVVIDPEVESWVWQDNPHVQEALGWGRERPLRPWLAEERLWPLESPKPADPRGCVETVLRVTRLPRSSSIYGRIASRVSVAGCTDPAFVFLLDRLRRWFPPGAPPRE
jgi:hypothetical protein